MLDRQFNDVDLAYLLGLPDSGLRENVSLEFKRQITRRESLLKEVCAFANTIGGDLVIGIEEEDGIPTVVLGVDAERQNLDQYELRIAQQIRSGIEPAVPFNIRCHQLDDGRMLSHLRVDQSLISPHRLVGSHKFYERVSSSSVEMPMENLRQSFGAIERFEKRAKEHHQKRITNNPYINSSDEISVVLCTCNSC